MRAFVDQGLCIGCGLCTSIAPEVFELNEAGKAAAAADTEDWNKAAVQQAMEGCPVSAIREEE